MQIYCIRERHSNRIAWVCYREGSATGGGGVGRVGVTSSSAGASLLGRKRRERCVENVLVTWWVKTSKLRNAYLKTCQTEHGERRSTHQRSLPPNHLSHTPLHPYPVIKIER